MMGTLRDFNLAKLGCNVFFETGTGVGYSLTHALAAGCFDALYSVEIDEQAFARACALFSPFRRLTLINSDSPSALRSVLSMLSRKDCVLFFLDAHFPGETSAIFPGYKADIAPLLRLPLEEELSVISALRGGCRDIIIADDLRIYEDGPFESGNMPEWAETLPQSKKNLGFVRRLFPDRQIARDFRKEGYLEITV